MSIFREKENLRKDFKQLRAQLSDQDVSKKSAEINCNFIENLLPKIYQKNSDKIFSLYFSSYREVATDLIADYFHQNQIKFSYPKIIQKNRYLDFILAEKNQPLVPNIFYPKILEPQNGLTISPDFIILPLLAFDDSLNRLGMGGGFFDRTIEFLKKRNSKIVTIGLAYDSQRSKATLPTDDTDQKLDFIVTEKNIFPAS